MEKYYFYSLTLFGHLFSIRVSGIYTVAMFQKERHAEKRVFLFVFLKKSKCFAVKRKTQLHLLMSNMAWCRRKSFQDGKAETGARFRQGMHAPVC